jgi:hypothetical protein
VLQRNPEILLLGRIVEKFKVARQAELQGKPPDNPAEELVHGAHREPG